MPRVSVIIPTFNCARFLGRALDTAFAQTFTDYEVIVVDDGSTDNTQDVLGRYGAKINYLYQPNRGLSAARNLALSKASGELIAYLDADDMWYPHKLKQQVAFLDAHTDCGLVHSDATFIDENDGILFYAYLRHTLRPGAQGACLLSLLRKNTVLTPTTVVEQRECIEKIGRFDERFRSCQDYFHWLLLAMEGVRFAYIDEPLAMYRKSMGSLSSNERRVWEELATILIILLEEKSLALRCGRDAAHIARHRLYALERDLAYLDRMDGQTAQAKRRLIGLIQEWPTRSELYVELLKSCVPPPLAERIRGIKWRWTRIRLS